VGFDPYKTIRRARNTRRGDLIFLGSFLVLVVALFLWAAL
jgi:hypothetical protein